MKRLVEKFWIALAWAMPHDLVKWCALRMMAHATTGQWGHEVTPALLMTTALQRWSVPHEQVDACHPSNSAAL